MSTMRPKAMRRVGSVLSVCIQVLVVLELSAVTAIAVFKVVEDTRLRNRELDLKERELNTRIKDIASRKKVLAQSIRRNATHELIRLKIPHDDSAEFVQKLWDEMQTNSLQ